MTVYPPADTLALAPRELLLVNAIAERVAVLPTDDSVCTLLGAGAVAEVTSRAPWTRRRPRRHERAT